MIWKSTTINDPDRPRAERLMRMPETWISAVTISASFDDHAPGSETGCTRAMSFMIYSL
jgi:hypothetical protein